MNTLRRGEDRQEGVETTQKQRERREKKNNSYRRWRQERGRGETPVGENKQEKGKERVRWVKAPTGTLGYNLGDSPPLSGLHRVGGYAWQKGDGLEEVRGKEGGSFNCGHGAISL